MKYIYIIILLNICKGQNPITLYALYYLIKYYQVLNPDEYNSFYE